MSYEIRTGKYGQYFHDNSSGEDLSLEKVLMLINSDRDKIAIAAMQGFLSHSTEACGNQYCSYPDDTAMAAYRLADAMVKARES